MKRKTACWNTPLNTIDCTFWILQSGIKDTSCMIKCILYIRIKKMLYIRMWSMEYFNIRFSFNNLSIKIHSSMWIHHEKMHHVSWVPFEYCNPYQRYFVHDKMCSLRAIYALITCRVLYARDISRYIYIYIYAYIYSECIQTIWRKLHQLSERLASLGTP